MIKYFLKLAALLAVGLLGIGLGLSLSPSLIKKQEAQREKIEHPVLIPEKQYCYPRKGAGSFYREIRMVEIIGECRDGRKVEK